MVLKKKKFMNVFTAIDVVSWFFANPQFFNRKKIQISECVIFGKLLEQLGMIENVSNRKKFDDVDYYYIFTKDFTLKSTQTDLVKSYKERCSRHSKQVSE
jgi:hypothetical protein